MNISLLLRAFVLCLLVSTAGGMMIDYANHAQDQSPYPSSEEVNRDYNIYIGEKVNFWAKVVAVREDGIVVNYGDTRLLILAPDLIVNPGDEIQVYGTLRSEHRLLPERIIVSPQSDRLYMLFVSVIGVLLSLTLFVRHWEINKDSWTITPRNK
jgi:hypothetical protein